MFYHTEKYTIAKETELYRVVVVEEYCDEYEDFNTTATENSYYFSRFEDAIECHKQIYERIVQQCIDLCTLEKLKQRVYDYPDRSQEELEEISIGRIERHKESCQEYVNNFDNRDDNRWYFFWDSEDDYTAKCWIEYGKGLFTFETTFDVCD